MADPDAAPTAAENRPLALAPLVQLQPTGLSFEPAGVEYATADDRGGRVLIVRGGAVELHRLDGDAPAQVCMSGNPKVCKNRMYSQVCCMCVEAPAHCSCQGTGHMEL